jgi:hypothetical protein
MTRDPFSFGDVPTRREGLVTQIRTLRQLLKTCTDPGLRRTARTTLRQFAAELKKLDAEAKSPGQPLKSET